jgi:hypothetical protein
MVHSKKEIEKELQGIKEQIYTLNSKNASMKGLLDAKAKAEETGSNMMALVRYLTDENRKTTMLLQSMTDTMMKIEYDLNAGSEESKEPMRDAAKELPISGLDAKMIQIIQIAGMACADDIKRQMNYKGRNAASARLNRLYKQGLLERYQLGHKVYYKYDVGKAAKTLIVSPPQ